MINTPVLLTLRNHFSTRSQKADIRVYWPKDCTAKGVSNVDRRTTLPVGVIKPLVNAIENELLNRFEKKQNSEPV